VTANAASFSKQSENDGTFHAEGVQLMSSLISIRKSLLLGVLLSQMLLAQSTVTVSETRFEGELGIPVNQLQDYTQFLRGHTLEKAKILANSERAVMKALRHHGFWKAQVKTDLAALSQSDTGSAGAVLVVTVHAGLQYRIKDVTVSGLASEFAPSELRECIHLKRGDIADSNEIGVGMVNLNVIFKKKGLGYTIVPSMTFDDAAQTLAVDFHIQK
jgi:outer membrane protein assembly factor BamA